MARLFTSADRTRIACSTGGSGPPLVLVHGTAADSHRWERVLPGLSQRFAIHALDRRGRGASGDAPAYALAREVDDILAASAPPSNGE